MRPTDKEIEDEINNDSINKTSNKYVHVFNAGFEKGAKWARDFDPWHYVEDGDLPELEETKEDYTNEIGEPVKISTSNGVLISCGKGDFAKAHFLTYESLNGYKYEFFQTYTNCLEFKPEEIKCWMHIPTPKK